MFCKGGRPANFIVGDVSVSQNRGIPRVGLGIPRVGFPLVLLGIDPRVLQTKTPPYPTCPQNLLQWFRVWLSPYFAFLGRTDTPTDLGASNPVDG